VANSLGETFLTSLRPSMLLSMHRSAKSALEWFRDSYASQLQKQAPGAALRVLEVGGRDVNGISDHLWSGDFSLLKLDMTPGPGVDFVNTDPYSFPVDSDSFDICFSTSVFEHVDFFWLLLLEQFRVLRPGGLLYLNAPSGWTYHRFPNDNWRFYPDSGAVMAAWLRRNGFEARLVESFILNRRPWRDFVCVIQKSGSLRVDIAPPVRRSINRITGNEGPLRVRNNFSGGALGAASNIVNFVRGMRSNFGDPEGTPTR